MEIFVKDGDQADENEFKIKQTDTQTILIDQHEDFC